MAAHMSKTSDTNHLMTTTRCATKFVQLLRWLTPLIILFGSTTVYSADKFIALSDIHFDPFATCRFYSSSCDVVNELQRSDAKQWSVIFEKYEKNPQINYFTDTNYSLLKISLAEVKQVTAQNKPDFMIILGDFLAHDFYKKFKKYAHHNSKQEYKRFVKKTLEYLTIEINAIDPMINVYPVLGNNDSYTGNYKVVPNGLFLREISQVWSLFIKDKTNLQRFHNDFKTGGYYAIRLSDKHYRIIILNTVLFSDKSQNAAVKEAAVQQLAWLKTQLAEAKQNNEWVIIAYHIPVGIDIFKTFHFGFSMSKEFWMPEYNRSYENILRQYPTVVSGILAGHVHTDAFQSLISKARVPVIFIPSISPIYGNNPGFKIISYTEDHFKLDNICMYDYPLNRTTPAWQIEYGACLQQETI